MSTLARNRDAPYRYDLLEKFEAGIALLGAEVKSIRAGRINLTGSYVSIRGNAAFLVNCHLAPYPMSSQAIDPLRDRQLLLKQTELERMQQALVGGGLTIVPVSVYTKGGFIKLELALAKGRRKADRRQRIAERETQRRIQRALRGRQR